MLLLQLDELVEDDDDEVDDDVVEDVPLAVLLNDPVADEVFLLDQVEASADVVE